MGCLRVGVELRSSAASNGSAVGARRRSEWRGAAAARTGAVDAAAAHADPQPAAGQRRPAAGDHAAPHGDRSSRRDIHRDRFKDHSFDAEL